MHNKLKILVFILVIVSFSYAKDYNPFSNAWRTDLPLIETTSNMGIIGLLELPTARILQDGHFRLGYSQIKPFVFYYATVGLLPRLEAGLRVTDIYKVDVRLTEPTFSKAFGSYKDQSPHFKFLLMKEGKFLPAVAVGALDFLGTALFKSEYIVFSKYNPYILPMDITVGYGKDRLDGFFAGGELFIHPRLSFLWEYSPIDFNYEIYALKRHYYLGESTVKKIKDSFPKKKSKYNFGLKLNLSKWFQTVLSYQYGDAFGFNVAFNMKLGEPWLPHIDRRFVLKEGAQAFIKKYNLTYEDFISYGLYRLGFSNISVYRKDDCLCIDLQNRGYLSNAKALVKVFRLIKDYPPKGIKKVKVILKSGYFPVISYTANFKDIMQNYIDKTFLDIKNFSLGGIKYPKERVYPIYTKRFSWGYNLKMDTKIADRSGYFAYKFKFQFPFDFNFTKDLQLFANVDVPIYRSRKLKSKPYEEIPIRSDFVYFFNNMNPYVSILKLYYFDSYFKNQFFNIQAGFLEPMYAGLGGDISYVFGNGNFAVTLGGDIAKKRHPRKTFQLVYKNKTFKDAFIDLYTYFPMFNAKAIITFARFLGGDKGVRVTFSRSFKGFEVGAWYTYSNAEGFKNHWNLSKKEYGFFVIIPFRMFRITDTAERGIIAVSIFNKDIGQLVERGTSIDRVYKYTPSYIMNNWY